VSTLAQLRDEAMAAATAAVDLEALDTVRVRYLGKKGLYTLKLRELGRLPAAERPAAGQEINLAKQELSQRIDERREQLKSERLNRELADPVVAYGSREERSAEARRLATRAAMAPAAAAEAAGYFARSDRLAEKDLVALPEGEQRQAGRHGKGSSGGASAHPPSAPKEVQGVVQGAVQGRGARRARFLVAPRGLMHDGAGSG